jgi:hypothetical protein
MTSGSENREVPKVFISFVRTNRAKVERLARILREYGILVWLERDQIAPSGNWQSVIRDAIREGAFFIACFSNQYNARKKMRMNEELMEAIDELRQRPMERSWFISVVLNNCTIPNWSIGSGNSLLNLECVDISQDWGKGVQDVLHIIDPPSLITR